MPTTTSKFDSLIFKVSEILHIHEDQLRVAFKTLGIEGNDTDIETFQYVTFTEFQDAINGIIEQLAEIPDMGIIPRPKLRHALDILQKETKVDANEGNFNKVIEALKPIGQWSDEDLLKVYSKDCSIEIEDQLKRRTHGQPAIIFNEDETVDIPNSLRLIKMSRGHPTPSTFIIGDNSHLVKVYPVGFFPKTVFHECPIHSNILLVEGYCEECGHKWDETQNDKNVFIRIINDNPDKRDRLIAWNMVREQNLEQLKKSFPKIFLIYKDMKETDSLPSLKRKVSKSKSGDPFHITENKSY